MNRFQPPSDELLHQAAELRASGQSWEQVSVLVHRTVRTLQNWPIRYARRWQQAYARAEQRLRAEAAAEAIRVLRKDLRSEDEKAHRAAADTILKHQHRPTTKRPRKRKDVSTSRQALAIASYIEGLSDAQIEALLAGLPGESSMESTPAAATPGPPRPASSR